MNLTFAPGSGPGGRLLSQFVNGGNIRLRKKQKRVRPRDRKMRSILQARREGQLFFGEDDVCAVS